MPEFSKSPVRQLGDATITLIRIEHPPTEPVWTEFGGEWQRIAPFPPEWPLPVDDHFFIGLTEEDRPHVAIISWFPMEERPDVCPFPRIRLFGRCRRG